MQRNQGDRSAGRPVRSKQDLRGDPYSVQVGLLAPGADVASGDPELQRSRSGRARYGERLPATTPRRRLSIAGGALTCSDIPKEKTPTREALDVIEDRIGPGGKIVFGRFDGGAPDCWAVTGDAAEEVSRVVELGPDGLPVAHHADLIRQWKATGWTYSLEVDGRGRVRRYQRDGRLYGNATFTRGRVSRALSKADTEAVLAYHEAQAKEAEARGGDETAMWSVMHAIHKLEAKRHKMFAEFGWTLVMAYWGQLPVVGTGVGVVEAIRAIVQEGDGSGAAMVVGGETTSGMDSLCAWVAKETGCGATKALGQIFRSAGHILKGVSLALDIAKLKNLAEQADIIDAVLPAFRKTAVDLATSLGLVEDAPSGGSGDLVMGIFAESKWAAAGLPKGKRIVKCDPARSAEHIARQQRIIGHLRGRLGLESAPVATPR